MLWDVVISLLSFMCAQGGIHCRSGPLVLLREEGISRGLEITILLFDHRELRSGLHAANAKESYWK